MVAAILQGLPVMALDGIYQVASTRVGQHAITFFDRILCIVEALNFYAAPTVEQQEALQESKELHDYQRPLPWFLFIPMLFFFRIVRSVMSAVSMLVLRQPPVTAMMVVLYVQTMRRKLRYVKIQGSRMMSNPESRKQSSLPWMARVAINLFTWGPLQLFTIVARLVLGDKHYHVYTSSGQPRSKRFLKKLKNVDNNDCSTAELLDKFADQDEDPANIDPDFEIKLADLLATETTEDEGEDENSEPEEDSEVRENGGAVKEGEENITHEGENQQENNGQPHQDNHNNEESHHQQEEHYHHHY